MRLVPALLVVLVMLGAAFALSAPAVAGEAEGGSCGLGCFDCENMCPLARQANEWRAVGTEALAVASKAHADHVAEVAKNLRRI